MITLNGKDITLQAGAIERRLGDYGRVFVYDTTPSGEYILKHDKPTGHWVWGIIKVKP
jgi:hypothetical protein